MRYNLKPTETIICKMPNGDEVRVVSADKYTQKVKVVRVKDGFPFKVYAADIGLRLPA